MDIERIDGILKYYELTKMALDRSISVSNLMDEKTKSATELAAGIFDDTIKLIQIAKEHIISTKSDSDGDEERE